MLYAASKDALKSKLVGFHYEIQATDLEEVEFDEIFEKVSAGGTK
jgi:cofilin